jgi:hypothetical protein
MDLDQLVAAVEESGGDDPLERLTAAAAVKAQIEHLGDELLDHFVNQARAEGCSWTQIGEALGVSRQAAHQRHGGLLDRLLRKLTQQCEVSIEGTFARFTTRARTAVIAAQTTARRRQHPTIDTEHVLLGLFEADDRNVAVVALGRLGVDKATVERLVDERVPPGETRVRGHVPFSPRAKKTLELALREALELGHNYLGTEHIVLALHQVDDGVAGQVLADQGVAYDTLRTTVLDVLDRAA